MAETREVETGSFKSSFCRTTQLSTLCRQQKVEIVSFFPAVSIPVGLSDDNLPIGVQIIGDILREDNVLRISYNIEKAVGFDEKPDNL